MIEVRTRADLRKAQRIARKFMLKTKKCGVFGDIGIGKSGATISALKALSDGLEIFYTLIIAPKDVVLATWPAAFEEWEEAHEFTYEILWNAPRGRVHHDPVAERRIALWERKTEKAAVAFEEAEDAYFEKQFEKIAKTTVEKLELIKLAKAVGKTQREYKFCKRVLKWGLCAGRRPADIHLINRENVAYLVAFWGAAWPYDMVVYDESSDLKNGQRVLRWRALRKVIGQTNRMIQLTGTPTPKGVIDLWGPMYILDEGLRLGHSFTQFQKKFFETDAYNPYALEQREGAMEMVTERIKDICITLHARDFMDLPPTIYNPIDVVLEDSVLEQYKKFEKDYVLEFLDQIKQEGAEVTAVNAAVLQGKLFQLANGTVYDSEKQVRYFHSAKLDRLVDYIDEMRGHNVLLSYWYQHDRDRILAKLKSLRKKKWRFELFNKDLIKPWNRGKINFMLVHPQSAGHGLNIQFGGRRILWYGPIPTRNLELYQQMNGRIEGARAVGLGPAFIDHLIAKDTQDKEGMDSLQGKAKAQWLFREYLQQLTNVK